jgi:prepilin-type N-terminal cleavage/methylation domain-containing protein
MKLLARFRADQRGFTLTELLVSVAVLGLVMAALLNVHMTGTTIALTGEGKASAQQGARAVLQIEEDIRLAGYCYPSGQTVFTAASPTSVTFWADLTNASTTLTANANVGATGLAVANGNGISTNDTIYLINAAQWEPLTVSSSSSTLITVPNPGTANAYPLGVQVGRPRFITYTWDGVSTLFRNAGDGTGPQPLVTGVVAFQLTYFDATDAPIAPASLANIRRVAISLTAGAPSGGPTPATFTLTSSARPRNL